MRLNRKLGYFVVLALFSSGCSSKHGAESLNDPKQRLEEYISKSFSVRSADDKAVLASYLTGESKERLEAWSNDQFLSAFVDAKREFGKLTFTEVKTVSATQMNITYELIYTNKIKGKEAKITNKKLCELTLSNGKWLIASVRNLKELIEYKNELSLP